MKYSLQSLLQSMGNWQQYVPVASHKVLSLIARCHTSALGYHTFQCQDKECNHVHVQYHSCRNRHCPQCGSSKAQQWMQERLGELLPVPYFHVVFTLPRELKLLAYANRKFFYKLLFDASAHTLLTLSREQRLLGAIPSITSVLHTWGQRLDFHPHIHCIVSGGGIDESNNWQKLKKGKGDYLFPYKVMERIFKGYFLEKLKHALRAKALLVPNRVDVPVLMRSLQQKTWIIHAKKPFGNAGQVVEYLGRYTQKVAISNHRILEIDQQNRVTFSYKDYADGGKRKTMTVEGSEFIRRFAQHILPPKFVRIRHYGILGNNKRRQRIAAILAQMDLPPHPEPVKLPTEVKILTQTGQNPNRCPKCQKLSLILIEIHFPKARDVPLIAKPNPQV